MKENCSKIKDVNGKIICEGDIIEIFPNYVGGKKGNRGMKDSLVKQVLFTSNCFNIDNRVLLDSLRTEYLSELKIMYKMGIYPYGN